MSSCFTRRELLLTFEWVAGKAVLFCLQMCNFFLAVHLSMYGAKPLWKEYLISLITLSYWVIVLHICYNKYWSIASQTSVFIIWFDWGGLQFVPQNPWQSDLGSHSSDRSAAPVRRCGAGRLWQWAAPFGSWPCCAAATCLREHQHWHPLPQGQTLCSLLAYVDQFSVSIFNTGCVGTLWSHFFVWVFFFLIFFFKNWSFLMWVFFCSHSSSPCLAIILSSVQTVSFINV